MILHAVILTMLATASVEVRAFESVLQLLGYQTKLDHRPGSGLLVIPASTTLTPAQAVQVRDFISKGGDAVIVGTASMHAVLGAHLSTGSITVKDVTEIAHSERYLRWNPTATVERFDPPDGAALLMQDQPTHQPLAFSANWAAAATSRSPPRSIQAARWARRGILTSRNTCVAPSAISRK
jgi:hypothetical protein